MIAVLASLGIFALAALGLALGVLMGRAPIQGSCGGKACEACATCPRRRT